MFFFQIDWLSFEDEGEGFIWNWASKDKKVEEFWT